MVRAPSSEKLGLKKGPWTAEEDRILRGYINQNGHGNWRALPRAAGLLRCGKSCRLRWMNYLRPDIKRGSFSREEEETIIRLHAELGNKWSIIAAKLPGRTDNEIKNIWHTNLKKRLVNGKSEITNLDNNGEPSSPTQSNSSAAAADSAAHVTESLESITESFWWDVLSATDVSGANNTATSSLDAEMDDNFWQNVFCTADDFTQLFEDFL